MAVRLAKEMGYLSNGKVVNWVQNWALVYFLADQDRTDLRNEKTKWEILRKHVDQLSAMTNPVLFSQAQSRVEAEPESEYIPFEDLGKLGDDFFENIDNYLNAEKTMTGSEGWGNWV